MVCGGGIGGRGIGSTGESLPYLTRGGDCGMMEGPMNIVGALEEFVVPSIDGKFALEMGKNKYERDMVDIFAVCKNCEVRLPAFMLGISLTYDGDEHGWRSWAEKQVPRILAHERVCSRVVPREIRWTTETDIRRAMNFAPMPVWEDNNVEPAYNDEDNPNEEDR